MTTPARQAEADRVELAYYWALNQLGNAMAIDSKELWAEVPATRQAAKASWWLVRLLELLFGFRREAHDLAIAYYRLTRALRTGYTIAAGDEQDGDSLSLNVLRDNFDDILDRIEADTVDGDVQPALRPSTEDAEIVVEDIVPIEDLIGALDEIAEQEAAEVLDELGIENMLRQIDSSEKSRAFKLDVDPKKDEQERQNAHQKAGNRQAAAAMRIMMNAARGLVYDLADTDLRVLGWVRYSKTGTPCGWCAMLISRGAVYKSQASAGDSADTDKYHDNCRCVAVPVFLPEQYANSGLFELNRQLSDLWPKVTQGKGGKEALRLWRAYFRKQEGLAQAAA